MFYWSGVECFCSLKIKFDSGIGWLFYYDIIGDNVKLYMDWLIFFMFCIEVVCVVCDVYLGYVFDDGLRFIGKCYCINRWVFVLIII